MKEKSKIVRILLTAIVLLVGGYYIQQTSQDVDLFNGYIDGVKADAPAAPSS